MTRGLRTFKRWMRSQGIEYSDGLQFDGDCEQGFGVKALYDLKEGDLIATIPKESCLTTKTSMASRMIDEAELGGSLGLAVAIMFERSLGGTSNCQIVKEDKRLIYEDWKEHIVPLVDAESLQEKSFGLEEYFAAKSLIASRSFEIDDYHGFGMVPLADLFNHKTAAEDVHFTSTSFSNSSHQDEDTASGTTDDCHIDGLNPSMEIDLQPSQLNYEDSSVSDTSATYGKEDGPTLSGSDSESSLSLGNDKEVLEMILVKNVAAGNEIFNTYGNLGNAALLHRYGFAESDNPFDIVNIDLDLVCKWCSSFCSDRHVRSRLSTWRKLGFSGCVSQNSEYFEVTYDGEPQLDLLSLLYMIFLQDEIYFTLRNDDVRSLEEFDDSMKIEVLTSMNQKPLLRVDKDNKKLILTSQVRKALISLADIRESLYGPSSLADDLRMLYECCCRENPKFYYSLVLRVGERRIIERLRMFAKCPMEEK